MYLYKKELLYRFSVIAHGTYGVFIYETNLLHKLQTYLMGLG